MMPSLAVITGTCLICAILMVALMRLVHPWTWMKFALSAILSIIAVFFGNYLVQGGCGRYLPQIFDFLKEFGLRVVIILVLIVFAVQVAALFSKFFKSKVWSLFWKIVGVAFESIANINPLTKKCAATCMWFIDCAKTGVTHFYEIKNEDNSEQVVGKVAELHKMSLLYDIIDYWAAGLCAIMVAYMVKYQWQFSSKTFAVWLFDVAFALSALFGCLASGKDLTWGEAHRRAHDGIYAQDHIGGWIYRIVQHTVGVIWDGPEQIAIFYCHSAWNNDPIMREISVQN
jgi:hypothetical protein